MFMNLLLACLPALVFSTAPTFSVSPDPPVIGQQATFTCEANKQGYKIKQGTEEKSTGQQTHVIAAFDATDNAGAWTCEVDVSGTSTASAVKNIVSTAVATPTFVKDPATIVEGQQLKMTCSASDATSYEFTKDGTAFTTGVANGVITITAYAEATDKGSYVCIAKKTDHLSRQITLEITSSAGQATISVLLLSIGTLLAKSFF